MLEVIETEHFALLETNEPKSYKKKQLTLSSMPPLVTKLFCRRVAMWAHPAYFSYPVCTSCPLGAVLGLSSCDGGLFPPLPFLSILPL